MKRLLIFLILLSGGILLVACTPEKNEEFKIIESGNVDIDFKIHEMNNKFTMYHSMIVNQKVSSDEFRTLSVYDQNDRKLRIKEDNNWIATTKEENGNIPYLMDVVLWSEDFEVGDVIQIKRIIVEIKGNEYEIKPNKMQFEKIETASRKGINFIEESIIGFLPSIEAKDKVAKERIIIKPDKALTLIDIYSTNSTLTFEHAKIQNSEVDFPVAINNGDQTYINFTCKIKNEAETLKKIVMGNNVLVFETETGTRIEVYTIQFILYNLDNMV